VRTVDDKADRARSLSPSSMRLGTECPSRKGFRLWLRKAFRGATLWNGLPSRLRSLSGLPPPPEPDVSRLPFHRLTLAWAAMACAGWILVVFPATEGIQGPARTLLLALAALEGAASLYLFSTLLKCLEYLRSPGPEETHPATAAGAAREGGEDLPRVAVLYLCAGDLDADALASLCRLTYPGPLTILVHDDAREEAAAREVERLVARLSTHERPIHLLRRTERSGGKPGAVNHVLARVRGQHDLLLLCDNDSTALDLDAIERAVPLFADPRVAAVQFRNVGLSQDGDGSVNRELARAIDVFDLFALHQAKHGLLPFLGHNGMLRLSAVEAVGGLREGCLSDDVDLSIRFALAGWRVAYARDIRFGEHHPASYGAFRRRAYKWAHGCGDVLRRHLLGVLTSRRILTREKSGFLEFLGFYALQASLIGYLVLGWLVLPWLLPSSGLPLGALAGSVLVLAAIFLPAIAYSLRRGRARDSWPFAWICALVYGSVALISCAGFVRGLLGRPLAWVPTNARLRERTVDPWMIGESLLGAALFAVPAILQPLLLARPATLLFVCVFLLTPLLALRYRPAEAPTLVRVRSLRRRLAMPAFLFLLVPMLWFGLRSAGPPPPGAPAVSGSSFLVNGRPFAVRGISYSPWRPGTGPGKHHPWPADELIEEDLRLIVDLGVNTILVHDAPPSMLDAAHRHGLMVISTHFINWQSIADDRLFGARADEIVAAVAEVARHPALLAVLLGNEVIAWVRDEHGNAFLEARLRDLAERVRAAAPKVLLSHANWPVTADLDLTFLDFSAFNLYPAWPREVAVRGYGAYIQEVLLPLAGGRPLLISEFGQNSLEASEERQARVLEQCWREIEARTAGGVVFAFADEWWKNYDNPIPGKDFWSREHAPDDELTRDLDPEEYYGIFSDARAPKPAAAAVRDLFREREAFDGTLPLYLAALAALIAYTAYVLRRAPTAVPVRTHAPRPSP
jgi:cellulose synthase/poly-beta-1,6-N-acetylglucosamine synthase-like glycosyltransferase